MKRKILFLICILLICLSGCIAQDTLETSFRSISQEEAVRMMEEEEGYVIVDVRTAEEYNESHIPDAINIPVETIGNEMPEELPDPDQIILIYCRSGIRAKTAAALLVGLGYVNVYEFGGIIDWKGDTVTEFNYTDDPGCDLIIEIDGRQLSAVLADNEATKELKKKLTEEKQIELHLSEYGSFEKVGPLPWALPTEDERITSETGDIFLYQGDQVTIFYGENTWSYTRLAHIPGVTKEELKEFLGEGDVTVTLFLDWWDY